MGCALVDLPCFCSVGGGNGLTHFGWYIRWVQLKWLAQFFTVMCNLYRDGYCFCWREEDCSSEVMNTCTWAQATNLIKRMCAASCRADLAAWRKEDLSRTESARIFAKRRGTAESVKLGNASHSLWRVC